MGTIKCLKDWIIEGKTIFKKGKTYHISRKERCIRANGIMIKPTKSSTISYWFWSNSDYFDVDSLFAISVLN